MGSGTTDAVENGGETYEVPFSFFFFFFFVFEEVYLSALYENKP